MLLLLSAVGPPLIEAAAAGRGNCGNAPLRSTTTRDILSLICIELIVGQRYSAIDFGLELDGDPKRPKFGVRLCDGDGGGDFMFMFAPLSPTVLSPIMVV